VTPKGRANAVYNVGIAVCAVGGLTLAVGRAQSNDVVFAFGAVLIAGYVALAVFGVATSRCPYCRRRIDLRGTSQYCPRCGRRIPLWEGEPVQIADC
jgi:hypothetical protein